MRLAPGSVRLAVPPAVVGLLLAPLSLGFVAAGVALGVAVLWFHRDPAREPPETGILAPADGRVSVVRREGDRLRVGIFMNVTDVHVNRAPIAGTVADREHVPGAHRPAFTKDSDRNERLHLEVGAVRVTLIAGWFARRIHPHVAVGDVVDRGERIGHVSFGSRADVLMPPEIDREDLAVREGDRVRAGESVIARR
ncbi:MAG: protein sorting system archaetidylserine decarboxylase [Halanaeroarchaeum sp.]